MLNIYLVKHLQEIQKSKGSNGRQERLIGKWSFFEFPNAFDGETTVSMAQLNNTTRPACQPLATCAKAAAVTMNAPPAKHRSMRALLELKAMVLANIGMAITGLVICLTVLVSAPANAAESGLQYVNRTTTNGLGSNNVKAVYVVGNNVYAATAPDGYPGIGGGLSISIDGGATFINKTTANGLGSNDVRGVFVVGTTVYAATAPVGFGPSATGGGLSISTDNGATWINKNMTNGLGSNEVTSVFVSGGKIYVGTRNTDFVTPNGGLSISADGGSTFITKKTGITTAAAPGAAAGDLCGSYDANAFGGNYGCNTVYAVYVNGLDIYLGTGRGLVYSRDGGSTFSNIAGGFGVSSINGISASGSNVYASSHGLNISRDSGASFPELEFFAENGNGVFSSGSNVYFASWAGLIISTDDARTFVMDTTASGLGSDNVNGIFVSGTTIYAGTSGGLSISTGTIRPATPAAIPTLSEWAMILMASLMGIFAFVRLRKVTLG
jgi:hypothetical protein